MIEVDTNTESKIRKERRNTKKKRRKEQVAPAYEVFCAPPPPAHPSRRHPPDFPPCFSINATSSITIPRSIALHMS